MSQPSSLAHYVITSKLGEGGMGAVYRATDTKLHRDVAIKVLPDAFAADPDRLARFSREAQVLSPRSTGSRSARWCSSWSKAPSSKGRSPTPKRSRSSTN
jgi:hypothetical protein